MCVHRPDLDVVIDVIKDCDICGKLLLEVGIQNITRPQLCVDCGREVDKILLDALDRYVKENYLWTDDEGGQHDEDDCNR